MISEYGHNPEQTNTREQDKFLAEKWQIDFNTSLQEVLNKEDSTLNDVIDVVWDKGILDRVAPIDPTVKDARVKLHREVYQGTRNDAELYWRIIYGIEGMKYASQHSFTIEASYLAGATQAWARAASMEHGNKFMSNSKNAPTELLDKMYSNISDRAFVKLSEYGVDKNTYTFIPVGSHGTFQGIPVLVERYTGDGLVVLKASSLEDHVAIGKLTDYEPVKPEEFHKNFVLDNK